MESMKLIEIQRADAHRLAPLAAAFRVTLTGYRGIVSEPYIPAGRAEIIEFLDAGFPVFAVETAGELAGYAVCRIDEPCLWVEHLFVRDEYRRRGVGTLLFEKAEELTRAMGEDTVYNFVHPNNLDVIGFFAGQRIHGPEHDRDPQALQRRTAHRRHPRGGRRIRLLRGIPGSACRALSVTDTGGRRCIRARGQRASQYAFDYDGE